MMFVAAVWDVALRVVCTPTGIMPITAIKQNAAIPRASVTSTSENTPRLKLQLGQRQVHLDWSDLLLKKSDPGVRIVCFRVGARGVEHALDRVRGAGDVGPAFDVCECRSNQHQQQPNDADDDQQFEQVKA